MKSEKSPIVYFHSQKEFHMWLIKAHNQNTGIWLRLAKKKPGICALTYDQALEEALCFGWIDGQKAAYDTDYWLQKFTPRRPRSMWSKINRTKAEVLIASSRMQPSGQMQIDHAKSDGRWNEAYPSQRTVTIPQDFLSEVTKYPDAYAFFKSLNSANRYAILYRIHTAKKPETRAERIQKYITMLRNHEKIHP